MKKSWQDNFSSINICRMNHMIVVNHVSLVWTKFTYECDWEKNLIV